VSALTFELPARLEADRPPETRDGVRLLVANRADGSIVHSRFRDLPRFLASGDLLVINTSATLPAAVPATRADGVELELRLSTPAPELDPESAWFVELRRGDEPYAGGVGERLALAAGASVELVAPFAAPRLWLARLDLGRPVAEYLAEHGRPIRYGYVPGNWPLDAYQNVYAVEPGSAEPASAGRPFTPELITLLVAEGVLIAPVTLHTGVSSQERHERPYAEPFHVPQETARLVNAVREWGGLVIAVGTTVVRALETVAQPDGTVTAGEGWTNLIVTAERGLWALDGLLTGWHEPRSSHLDVLRAAAGDELLARSYEAALEHGYRWHEFGDSQLVIAPRPGIDVDADRSQHG
jgi:S-adenosylmethionine:tRNA ribosyltransferase-isomerase